MVHSGRIDRLATHRFVPAQYAGGASALHSLLLPENVLTELEELDAATSEQKLAERSGSLAIGPGELLFGVPEAEIVNAAYCYPGPYGGRFHDNQRGAWYAGAEVETSMAEVEYHRLRFLKDARITDPLVVEYQDFLADFYGEFSLLDAADQTSCLQPEPVPACYKPGQALANTLLFARSNGISYPSVRHQGGTCLACFRPALVFHPRRGERYSLTIGAATSENAVRPSSWELSA